jgi:hypothetical protein
MQNVYIDIFKGSNFMVIERTWKKMNENLNGFKRVCFNKAFICV